MRVMVLVCLAATLAGCEFERMPLKVCHEYGACSDAASLDAVPADAASDALVSVDAAFLDASPLDAAMPDARAADASLPDAALPDTSPPDAAVPDALPPDAGPPPSRWPIVFTLSMRPECGTSIPPHEGGVVDNTATTMGVLANAPMPFTTSPLGRDTVCSFSTDPAALALFLKAVDPDGSTTGGPLLYGCDPGSPSYDCIAVMIEWADEVVYELSVFEVQALLVTGYICPQPMPMEGVIGLTRDFLDCDTP